MRSTRVREGRHDVDLACTEREFRGGERRFPRYGAEWGGRVAETGRVGAEPATQPSAARTTVFDLAPGPYVFLRNIVGHYASGMHGQRIVK